MANRFQIRSGSSIPSPSDLLDKELGYNVNDKKLYINNNGSIEEITTDIVDNLITNDSDKALSAKQGKLLNEVKLDSSAYTAADVLAKMLTVDGAGSGLDADMLDNLQTTTSGNRWGVIPYVHTNGVMEVGKYIDSTNRMMIRAIIRFACGP